MGSQIASAEDLNYAKLMIPADYYRICNLNYSYISANHRTLTRWLGVENGFLPDPTPIIRERM